MTVNPLVAARVDTPVDAWAGVWIVEDIRQLHRGVADGSWVDATLGGIGATLDGLAMVSDPVGVLLQYGVAWIIEHVRPLSHTLDLLAGDPGQIAGHAQTWRNVAARLTAEAQRIGDAVRTDVAGWGGSAGPAYRAWADQQQQAVAGLAQSAEAMATITEAAGLLVSTVRLMVRDAIAACVSRLVSYAIEEAASLGFASALVIEQVSTLVASWGARIAKLLRALIASLHRLLVKAHALSGLIDKLKEVLSRLIHGREAQDPHRAPDGSSDPSGQRSHAPDFDPGMDHGPLGDDFHPSVVDPRTLFSDKEREIADRLAEDGIMVHPRERVDNIAGKKNPDAMTRSSPDDPGTVTEFKTPDVGDSNGVRRSIVTAGRQVKGDGLAVVDGRRVGLTEEEARRGYARAVGQARVHGQPMPTRVLIILADNAIISLP